MLAEGNAIEDNTISIRSFVWSEKATLPGEEYEKVVMTFEDQTVEFIETPGGYWADLCCCPDPVTAQSTADCRPNWCCTAVYRIDYIKKLPRK